MALILLLTAGCSPPGSTPIRIVDGLTNRAVPAFTLGVTSDDSACTTPTVATDEDGEVDLLPGCDAPWTLAAAGWSLPEAVSSSDERVVVRAWRTPGAGAWALGDHAPAPLPSAVPVDRFVRLDGTEAMMPVALPGAMPVLTHADHLFLGEDALTDALLPLGPIGNVEVLTAAGARTIPAWRWFDTQGATAPAQVEGSPARHVRLAGLPPGTWALTDASRTRAQLFEVRDGG